MVCLEGVVRGHGSFLTIGLHRPKSEWSGIAMSRQNTGSVGAGHWKTVALALLAVLAIGQSVVAGQRLVRVAPAGSPVAVDDDVSGLMVRLSGGETFELGAGK